jgi:molybdopterin synthase catalytic subunit
LLERVKIVKKGEVVLQDLVDELKNTSEAFECGAIACYVGFVRGIGKNGSRVQKLSYEAWEEEAVKSLTEIRREILEENGGIKDLLIYHVIDEVKPKDETVFIVALGTHRHEAINAAKKAIDEIKKRSPIWKKEYTEKGAYWI